MNTYVSESPYLAIPVLLSTDLRRSSAYYSDALGFAVHKEADGLRVRRDDIDLKITRSSDATLSSNLSVVFRVKDLKQLHREFNQRSLPRLGKLKEGGCGQTQFSLRDPDGNSLYFVEFSS